MTKQELYGKLITELDRSLVVDDKTKDYWMKNYQTLPVSAVDFFCEQLVKTNEHVDNMIAAGLDANPGLAEQIVLKSKDAKKKAYKYLEAQETKEENPEEFLEASLK